MRGSISDILHVSIDCYSLCRLVLFSPSIVESVASMNMNKIVKMFERGSVCVVGMKGTGKDMLTGNVIARRKKPYACNINYNAQKSRFEPLDFTTLTLSGNTPFDLVDGKIKPYRYPYEDGTDIYISDVGIYFPSQYCNELNKRYSGIALFEAVSRHLGDARVHLNCQNYGRIYDKMREMSDTYILCEWCKYFKGWVIQSVIVYDKSESCANRIKPCRVSTPLLGESRKQVQMYKDNFYNQHGNVRRLLLFYRNKTRYDTRYFKGVFENGTFH